MDLQTYIRRDAGIAHSEWDAMLKDLSEAQFNWAPPGLANSIAATALHVYVAEDIFVQGKLLGQPLLFESQGWAARLGLSEIPDPGNQWAEVKSKPLDMAAVLAYGQAIWAATSCYLEAMTEAGLEKEVTLGPHKLTAAGLLSVLVRHITCHGGEVAAVKGIQGLQGQLV